MKEKELLNGQVNEFTVQESIGDPWLVVSEGKKLAYELPGYLLYLQTGKTQTFIYFSSVY